MNEETKLKIGLANSTGKKPSKEWMLEHYVDRRLSSPKIAQLLDVSKPTVLKWMTLYGIQKRSKRENSIGNTSRRIAPNGITVRYTPPVFVKNKLPAKRDKKYQLVHTWLYRNFGKANKCELNMTHINREYEWANTNGKYEFDINNFAMLCKNCHRKLDMTEAIKANIRMTKTGVKYAI